MTFRPRRISSRQSSGSGSRATMASRLPAMDLMGVSELLSSWPSTRTRRCQACSSCSLRAWVRSEITTSSSGRPCSRMRVRRTPQRPAPPGKTVCRVVTAGPSRQTSSCNSAAVWPEQALGGSGQQALAGAIHQAQALVLVEGEDGHVDFAHHGAQQGGGLHGAEALLAQRAAQRVDFAHDFAQRVVGAGRAAAHREIALAQGAQQVGEGLQREDHALAHGQGEPQPGADDQHGEGPLHLGGRSRRVHSIHSATAEPGSPASSASRTTRPSWLMHAGFSLTFIAGPTGRTAAAAGRARCGSGRARWRRG